MKFLILVTPCNLKKETAAVLKERAMKESKFIESQILAILGESEAGLAAAEVYRKHGISTANCYQWNSKFAEMSAIELKRGKGVETENKRIKRMYADLS